VRRWGHIARRPAASCPCACVRVCMRAAALLGAPAKSGHITVVVVVLFFYALLRLYTFDFSSSFLAVVCFPLVNLFCSVVACRCWCYAGFERHERDKEIDKPHKRDLEKRREERACVHVCVCVVARVGKLQRQDNENTKETLMIERGCMGFCRARRNGVGRLAVGIDWGRTMMTGHKAKSKAPGRRRRRRAPRFCDDGEEKSKRPWASSAQSKAERGLKGGSKRRSALAVAGGRAACCNYLH
jgi:hypothetical protein